MLNEIILLTKKYLHEIIASRMKLFHLFREKLMENNNMNLTYLTTEELSERIKYNARTIRNDLKDSVLLEGRHYIRPFGQRKILFIWENIEEDMYQASSVDAFAVPMANGGICYGTH